MQHLTCSESTSLPVYPEDRAEGTADARRGEGVRWLPVGRVVNESKMPHHGFILADRGDTVYGDGDVAFVVGIQSGTQSAHQGPLNTSRCVRGIQTAKFPHGSLQVSIRGRFHQSGKR